MYSISSAAGWHLRIYFTSGGQGMKEIKSPKKPLIFYYGIVLLLIVLFNLIISPILMERQVMQVDYGTFMSMTEKKNIGRVEVEDSQIIFTDKNNDNIYKRISVRLK